MFRDKVLGHLRRHFSHQMSQTKEFSALDLVFKFGSPLEALAYSYLFWPIFVEKDDMVFLKDLMEDQEDFDRLRVAKRRLSGNRKMIEESFNFIEVPNLFGRRKGETTDQEDEVLAEILRDCWEARLKHQFPNRRFEVKIVLPSKEGEEIGVLFRQQV